MILDVLKQFIEEECPLVSGKKIKVNYLGEKPQSYTVDTVPANPVVRKYPVFGNIFSCLPPGSFTTHRCGAI